MEKPSVWTKEYKPTPKPTEADFENPIIDDINNYGTVGNKKSETQAPNIDIDPEKSKPLERNKRQSNKNNWNKMINTINNNTNNDNEKSTTLSKKIDYNSRTDCKSCRRV